MKKIVIACLLALMSTVVIAGSREVAPVSSGSASSTFGVGVPSFSAVRGAGPATKAAPAKGSAATTKKPGVAAKKSTAVGKKTPNRSARPAKAVPAKRAAVTKEWEKVHQTQIKTT